MTYVVIVENCWSQWYKMVHDNTSKACTNFIRWHLHATEPGPLYQIIYTNITQELFIFFYLNPPYKIITEH
jgi:hypothetical protein